MHFICLVCQKSFSSKKRCKNRIPQYCSKKCYSSRVVTAETREKQAIAKRGKIPWNKGIKMWEGKEHPKGTLGKIGLGKGRKRSEETRKKLSDSHIGLKCPHNSKEKHWNWQNGKTSETEAARKSADYVQWRSKVFERDKHSCVICLKIGGYLHADHIIPFSRDKEKRFDVDNGRTLCVECHNKTETYGGRIHRHPLEKLDAKTK